MSDPSKSSIQIDAPVADVRALIFDPAGYPGWSTSIQSAIVLEKDSEGRATKIEMKIKAGQVKDRVILDYDWSKAPSELTFTLDDGDILTEMSGGYTITEASEESTTVEYQLSVALSMPVPAMMRTKAERDTIELALKELKTKLEA